ncbi:MAG TPA: ATP-binding protein [Gaiellaceae bacterium]|nr:ATP-binding protein [Gaiellaceae bacterium]
MAVDRLMRRRGAQASAGLGELRPEELTRRLDPASLAFETTEEIEPLVGTIGQPRALDAIESGLAIGTAGFNLFLAGPVGSGRRTTVLDVIRAVAAERRAPDDWVYVHDFRDPDRPKALRLPAGRGGEFARALDEFLEAARRELRRAFESEDYERRQRETLAEIQERRHELDRELEQFAAERGYALKTTVTGVVTMPLLEGEPLSVERFEALPADKRTEIERAGKEIEERTAGYAHRLHELEKEAAQRLRELQHEVARFATGPLFRDLRERFGDEAEVLAHLADVEREVVDDIADFRDGESEGLQLALGGSRDPTARFRVNLLVANEPTNGAPVVVEPNPTYYNLLGRLEYRAALGSMVTDFREIKPGALHRANGGFIVLDALDLLRHAFSWEALKRALKSREVRVENLGEEFSALPSVSLRPAPIPLDVKVILIGPALLYHLLYQLDDDFRELFKVKADFSPDLDWTPEHHHNYAAFVSRWVRDNGLRHFDRAAVARTIEYGARLRDDQDKLSARLIEISDVVSEASFWAGRAGHEVVRADDVELAIRKKEYRSSLLEERLQELVERGTIVIETDGAQVGRVNGLSILELGDYAFGRPVRVSARVSLGRDGVGSIEREIKLSGPIHSKGVGILAGYLAGTYARELPLALSATLTFEQSYDEIEGDSASSTELYALLSALAELPLDQSIAVTGSVDQHGNVQAVGGVTRKIEGFFAVCRSRGLTGRQGVIVPAANRRNLMLSDEVVDAVRAGRFHVWTVRTIDEGIALLTGVAAGQPGADGAYPPETVHGRVQRRLRMNVERLRELGGDGPDDGKPRLAP